MFRFCRHPRPRNGVCTKRAAIRFVQTPARSDGKMRTRVSAPSRVRPFSVGGKFSIELRQQVENVPPVSAPCHCRARLESGRRDVSRGRLHGGAEGPAFKGGDRVDGGRCAGGRRRWVRPVQVLVLVQVQVLVLVLVLVLVRRRRVRTQLHRGWRLRRRRRRAGGVFLCGACAKEPKGQVGMDGWRSAGTFRH